MRYLSREYALYISTCFFRFLYTDEIQITDSNLDDILRLADKYDIPLLLERCSAYMIDNIEYETVCQILCTANLFKLKEVIKKALEMICIQAQHHCLRLDGFLNLDLEELKLIASSEMLTCSEVELLDALLRWGEGKCKDEGKETTDEEKRSCLGDVFYQIRFPIMEASALKRVSTRHGGLLTEAEFTAVAHDKLYGDHFSTRQQSQFPSLPRKGWTPSRVIFRHGNQRLRKVRPTDRSMKMEFSLSRDLWLCGIVLYGPTTPSDFYMVTRLIYNEGTEPYSFQKMMEFKDGKDYTCDVFFDKPIHIQVEKKYTVEIEIFVSREVQFYRILEDKSHGFGHQEKEDPDVENVQHSSDIVGNRYGSHSDIYFGMNNNIRISKHCDQIAGLLLI